MPSFLLGLLKRLPPRSRSTSQSPTSQSPTSQSPTSQLPLKLLGIVGLILILSLIAIVCGKRRPQAAPPSLPPLPQDPDIQVYFNQSQSSRYQERDRPLLRSGDDLEAVLEAAIAQAQTRIDVAVQELRLPRIAEALIARQRAGVRVRVILEHQYNQTLTEWAAQSGQLEGRSLERYQGFRIFLDRDGDGQVSPQEAAQRDAIALLRAAGVPTLDDRADGSKGSGLMHHKFMVVDGRTLVTGSANWTPSDLHQEPGIEESRGNANQLLRLESATLAQRFTQEFETMWGDGPGGKPDSQFGVQKPVRSPQQLKLGASSVVVAFSPTGQRQPWANSSNGLIARTLAKAQARVDLALFVFSEQGIADALSARRSQGVAVRALIDPGFAFRDYSEALDLLGVALLRQNCQPEPNNRPWHPALTSVGVPDLPEGDSLHHKFAVLDGQAVITGSHNWSKAANEQNDETLLLIENPVVAAHFQREFDRLYRSAALGLPVSVQDKLTQQRARCP
ncbi:MAG: competence protein ComE [Synechococcales cyanobacterium CRU_2_2]|nr:competence protein ComE [Synechococcales cyanobacterium CRU_2_2]